MERLLRRNHSYGERIALFIQHSDSIGWTEEAFERLMGVFTNTTVGVVIHAEQPDVGITIRASEPIDIQYINAFSQMVSSRYPKQFEQEYCQHAYNSSHYEHPFLSLFEGYLPLIKDDQPEFVDVKTNAKSEEFKVIAAVQLKQNSVIFQYSLFHH